MDTIVFEAVRKSIIGETMERFIDIQNYKNVKLQKKDSLISPKNDAGILTDQIFNKSS